MKDKKNNIKKEKKESNLIVKIILFIVALYIVYTVYLLMKQPSDMWTVESGTICEEETAVGYVIRDEEVIKGNDYKNGMSQIVSEGQKVANGESVFRYYGTDEEQIENQIKEIDLQIQSKLSGQTLSYSADIKSIENQIDQKVEELSTITDMHKIKEYKKNIENVVTKKASLTAELLANGSEVKDLVKQRNSLQQKLDTNTEYVKAPSSGLVSYRVDGLEDVLTAKDEEFGYLSEGLLEGLNLKVGKIISTSDEAGKIMDNFKSYVAVVMNSEIAKKAKAGDSVKVRLSNNTEVSASISYIVPENEEGNVVIVFELDRLPDEFINYRKVTLDIVWWDDTGLKVPNQAIVEKDGLNYVVKNTAGYLSKLLVKIEASNDKYSIVKTYSTDQLKEIGFTSKDINSYKKITIYDEILMSPNLDKVE